MPAADLTFRKDLTVALSSTQVDSNFEVLRDFSNGLETLYNTSFNQDGTLKNSLTAADLKADAVYYAADTGTTDEYAITLTPAITEYTDGMTVAFKANTANDGEATLNVNAVGAKSLTKRKDVPLATGDITSGQIVEARYDSALGGFQVVSQLANQVGLPLGTTGQHVRVNSDNALEFYTPTIAEAEFYGHATPYWFVAHKNVAYGTDESDSTVTVTVESGTTTTWQGSAVLPGVENLFKDLGSNFTDATLPILASLDNHKYADLVFDSTKFKTAGGGEDVNESSGLFVYCQSIDSDAHIHGVSVYCPTVSKYVPVYTFETGDPKYSDIAVHTSMVNVPRMESGQYRFRAFWTSNTSADLGIGFKILGHY